MTHELGIEFGFINLEHTSLFSLRTPNTAIKEKQKKNH